MTQRTSKDALPKPKYVWIVLVITLLAFALRVYQLGAQSYWWDEIAPLLIARLPFPQWLEPVFLDRGHPPGLYFLLSLWIPWGESEFFVRFLSVFEGTLTVAIMARVGTLVKNRQVGVIAAMLMALSPFYIWYAQESRMYAPLILAAISSTWAFLELLKRPRRSVAFGLFLVDLFGLYAHYLFGLYLLMQLLYLVMARGKYPRALRLTLLATFGAGLLFAPWLVALELTNIRGRPNLDWIPNAQWYDPGLSWFAVLQGASLDPAFLLNWVAPALALVLVGVGVWTNWRNNGEMIRWLGTWLFVPWLFLDLLSSAIPGRSLYVDRYLTPFAPALLLLIALGAQSLLERQRILLAVAGVIFLVPVLLSLGNMYRVPRYARDDWRGLTAFLHQNADLQHDAVLLDLSLMLPFDLYQSDTLGRIQHPLPTEENALAWTGTVANFQGHQHVWLVTTALPINIHRFYPDEPGQRAVAAQDLFKAAMDRRYPILSESWFPGLLLTQYQVLP